MKSKILISFLIIIILFFICLIVFLNFEKQKIIPCDGFVISGDVGNLSIFDNAYNSVGTSSIFIQNAKGGIVNHHLLGANFIAQVTESFSNKDKIKNIYLISPNHFDTGHYPVEVFLGQYKTPYGTVCTNKEVSKKLLNFSFVGSESKVFEKEHGLYNIAPFIKRSFPNANIVAVAVKENANIDDLKKLSNLISVNDDNSIVLGSFDFSHNLNVPEANFHDEKSLDTIESFDENRALNLDIDSTKGLYLVMNMLKGKAEQFKLIKQSNSGIILNNKNSEDVTSYIDGVFIEGNPKPPKVSNLLFFGDLMLDRAVAKRISASGTDYIFEDISRLLMGNDAVIANLEGAFSSNKSIAQNNSSILKFTFDPNLTSVLIKNHINYVSQSNNHMNDFGISAEVESRNILKNAGIDYFGDFFNETNKVSHIASNGKKVSLIAYNEFSHSNFDKTLGLIKSEKELGNFVIVMPHWGIEYESKNSSSQATLAHSFINAGADAIIGSHPHVVENIEIYKNKPIFYSLGNFVFDQDFSKETREGLSVGITLDENKESYSLFPFDIIVSKLSLKNKIKKEEFLNRLANNSDISIKSQILEGKIIINN